MGYLRLVRKNGNGERWLSTESDIITHKKITIHNMAYVIEISSRCADSRTKQTSLFKLTTFPTQ